jgi:L-ascorbate metabolism protein UlaG (beta-lactamase superfamily)
VLKGLLLFLLWFPIAAWGGLMEYRDRVVADKVASQVPTTGVKVTYLGVNGYLLESGRTTLLVDPYFTRTPLAAVALNFRQRPSEEDLAFAEARLPRKIDAILVTHGHFDHLLDVPELARRTGAEIVASPTGVNLVRATGARKTKAVLPGGRVRLKGASVRVLDASHDCILGRVPFPGHRHEVPPVPRRPSDWVCGEPLAFLIEMNGKRIYVDSGGTRQVSPPEGLGRIDLAILGVALRDSRERLSTALERLRPRYFLPSHQDDFFRPVQRGFTFGWLTDFPDVLRRSEGRRLILLDYFSPWTLR